MTRLQVRGRHLMVLDAVATVVSFVLALALRFDAPSPLFALYLETFAWVLPLLVGSRLAVFLALRMYQRVWRYASVEELVAVVAGVSASSVIAYGLVWILTETLPIGLPGFPRSLPVIDGLIMLALGGGWRFSFRLVGVRRRGARGGIQPDRALVVGSGTAAIAVIRELRSDPDLPFEPVGVVADDLPQRQSLMGLPVLGGLEDLGAIVQRERAAVVLLALPAAPGRELRRLVRMAETAGARCLTVPSVAEVAAGRVTLDALREIEVEDLLRRAPARIDLDSVAASFADKVVLITGAGGSIGAELARQLTRFRPRVLVLLGRGENSIFETMESLHGLIDPSILMPVILDIRDARRLDRLIGEVRPDVVFHAAAHKHVTFMELSPEEAVATNVLGTAYLLNACVRHAVGRFVLISSDKAVNPTSVMGVTKRVAELLVQEAAQRATGHFATVRFGNVLSSRGSVVPLFRRQLAQGRALTVTHPDVSRYFMTIPEAVQLVIQAAVIGRAPGDTFVLDMGDPVRIADLARDLAALHGLEVGKDVDIEFTGLRPGEKLHEELYFPWERPVATSHEAIFRVSTGPLPDGLPRALATFDRFVDERARPQIIQLLRELVVEYSPSGDLAAIRQPAS